MRRRKARAPFGSTSGGRDYGARLRVTSGPRRPDADLVHEVRDYVRAFKQHYNECADCGLPYPPWVLEFDHIDPRAKLFNVGDASSVPSMEALLEEIDKCDVVCSNCHKTREHHRRRN